MTVLSVPIASILFERQRFTAEDTSLVGFALKGYAVAFVFQSMIPLLVSAGLALKKGWVLVVLHGVMVVFNWMANAALIPYFGLLGITLATSLVTSVFAFILVVISSPNLIRGSNLWLALGRGMVLSICGLIGIVTISLMLTGLEPEAPGFLWRSFQVFAGTLGFAVSYLLFGRRILKQEWNSLSHLRSKVASDLEESNGFG